MLSANVYDTYGAYTTVRNPAGAVFVQPAIKVTNETLTPIVKMASFETRTRTRTRTLTPTPTPTPTRTRTRTRTRARTQTQTLTLTSAPRSTLT